MQDTTSARGNRTFRPVNTLLSPRKPKFDRHDGDENTPPRHNTDGTLRLDIGHDSSLFDSSDDSLADTHFQLPTTTRSSSAKYPAPRGKSPPAPALARMVNEREAPRPSQSAQSGLRQPLDAAQPSKQPAAIARSALQPEFGHASPLRNPLKQQDFSNVFNSNQRRAEHHRPRPAAPNAAAPNPSSFRPPPGPRPTSTTDGAPQPNFHLPGQKPRPTAPVDPLFAPQTNPMYTAQPIRVPTNRQPKTVHAAPRPVFSSSSSSSIGPNTTFQTFRPPQPRNVIDLTKATDDDDDAFDPDAALREDAFGAADPHSYIDAGQTSENIKALLEGAFDDDQDRPKMRLRKRAQKRDKPKEDCKMLSLEDKLRQLELDTAAKADPEQPEKDDEDDDDGTVEGLTVKLLPHQVDGVSWMIDKEIGERKKNGILPKGGILADDMGLGKTVQSVALILTNPRPAVDAKPPPENPKRKMPTKEVGKGTLVVAPLALIKQWESEIKTKVEKDHALRVLVHHGPSRTKSHLELKKYDVVITTYQILASEHAGSSDHADGVKIGCFGVHWYRVILDEAHSIKNRNAKSTQATYALRSWYRWCLTGTPMQNNLDELQSLICFLQIKPYNHLGTWKAQITTPMKNGQGNYAIKRIQYFLRAFMKRRTKDILKQEGALNFGGKAKSGEDKSPGMRIVERKVESVICELDPQEREFYDQLQSRAQSRLEDMMTGDKADYIGALVLLLRLRQACNHPELIRSAMSKDKDALSTGAPAGNQSPRKPSSAVDDDMDALAGALGGLSVETKFCDVCNVKLSPSEVSGGTVRCGECEGLMTHKDSKKKQKKEERRKGRVEAVPVKKPLKSRNRKIVIDSDDEEDEEGEGEWLVSEDQQKMPSLGRAGGQDDEDAEGGGETLGSIDTLNDSITSTQASESASESDEDDSDLPYSDSFTGFATSTKIRKLLRILHAESPSHKTIVFSQFTSMLDIIEPFLARSSIKYVRYDGGMRNDAREASLNSLRNDKSTRVLLCSLKCGSLGLNLTAASRVVIIEPFWNPFVEEQAIDRVHRLNQTVDVKVYKLTVANTVEEKILELQEKKRELAKAAIEGGKAVAKLTMRDLMSLFGRNPEDGRVSVGSDKGPALDFEKPKVLRPEQRPVSQDRRAIGNGPRLSNERRGRFESGTRRITNEDPVYGRR
ncbi:hypothetical protein MBLNU459_g7264t1 [Dothideomycetes sp. NU459]